MNIQAEAADGSIHEFPEGTDQSVVNKVMKDYATKVSPILRPAVKAKDGLQIGTLGQTHADIDKTAPENAQGFVDNKGSFLTRSEASKVAKDAGLDVPDSLHSEDLNKAFGIKKPASERLAADSARYNPNNLPDDKGNLAILRAAADKVPDLVSRHPWAIEKPDAQGNSGSYIARAAHDLALAPTQAIRGGLNMLADVGEGYQSGKNIVPQATMLGLSVAGAPGLKSVAETGAKIAAEEAPVVAEAVTPKNMLTQMGVKLTPGQMVGGAAKSVEDKARSLPIAGDAISAAQRRSMEQFNVGAINKALEPIGAAIPKGTKAGQGAIEAGQEALDKAYGSLLPKVRFVADDEFKGSMGELKDLTSEMPPADREQFDSIFKNRVEKRLGPEGNMDGKTLKQVESELTQKVGQLKANKQYQLSDAVNQMRSNIRDALERQHPEHADELQKINKAYAMFSRVEDASIRRPTANGVFTPGDLLGEIKTNAKRTGNKRAFARGDSLMQDYASAGQKVLGNTVPDSGTAGRLSLAGGLLLAGGAYKLANMIHQPEIFAGLIAGTLPYTRPGMAGLNFLRNVAPSIGPATQRAAGNALMNLAPRAGLLSRADAAQQ